MQIVVFGTQSAYTSPLVISAGAIQLVYKCNLSKTSYNPTSNKTTVGTAPVSTAEKVLTVTTDEADVRSHHTITTVATVPRPYLILMEGVEEGGLEPMDDI